MTVGTHKNKNEINQAILEVYYGPPKKGDYFRTNRQTWKVFNGTRWVGYGKGASTTSQPPANATGVNYYSDNRINEALNNLGAEQINTFIEKGILDESYRGYALNSPLVVPNLEGKLGENGEVDSSVLRYPSDAVGTDTDYMLFDFYNYVPPFGQGQDQYKQLFEDYKGSGKREFIFNETLGAYNSSVAAFAEKAEGYPTILTYMPEDVQDAFSAGWEGKAFGNIAGGLIQGTAGSDDFVDALGNVAQEANRTLKRLSVNATATAITNLAKSITGDSITEGDVFSGSQGVVRNPNAEMLFQKMNFRTFDHTLKMAPFNRKDEENILGMIKAFKRAMLPSYSTGPIFEKDNTALDAAFVKVPKLVQVAYMRGGGRHPYLPKYKLCALTDININYTPDNNYATFKQGGPVSYEIKLNFMETKLVFSEEVNSDQH